MCRSPFVTGALPAKKKRPNRLRAVFSFPERLFIDKATGKGMGGLASTGLFSI